MHSAAWYKRTIELQPYKQLPTSPINPDESKELAYLNELRQKSKHFDAAKELGC